MNSMEKQKFLVELGCRVKQLRVERQMSQEELANKVGYTSENARSSIQKLESGKSDLPASKIYKLANVFGVPIAKLMGWADEFDNSFDVEHISKEVEILEAIQDEYGITTQEAVSMYLLLDSDDQGEIRGEMKQMLKSSKYSAKEESKNA